MAESSFAGRLRELRDASGKSRAVLARDAAVTYAYVRQLETGERAMPRGDKLSALASALGVSVDALLEEPGVGPRGADDVRDERADLVAAIEVLCARLDVASLRAVREVIEGFVRLESSAPRRDRAGVSSVE